MKSQILSANFSCSLILPLVFLALNVLAGQNIDPAQPERPNDEWRMRHGERVADVKSHAGQLDVLFIGDSITGGWLNVGKAVWEKEFVPLHAINIGISGSQTSHILWQLENGAIDEINPRLAVLMIGVNNVMAAPSQSATDIARGISAIVARLREKLPRTKVLLLGTFPKDRSPTTPDRRKIQELNSIIAKLDDGNWIRFLEISSRLLDEDGNLTAEISPDGVHLTESGYQKWAVAIRPAVCDMMAVASGFQAPETDAALKLWYQQPATRFYEAAPLGNGRIGAMVFGGVEEERIILNESSVWSGSPQHADREGAHAYLPEIRRLLREGKNPEAEALVNQHFTCVPSGSGAALGANVQYGSYQVLGNLRLRFGQRGDTTPEGTKTAAEIGKATNYLRTLDLQNAVASIDYAIGDVKFHRRHFISAPDEIFVSRLTCSKTAGLTFGLALDRPERFTTEAVGNDELLMSGVLNDGREGKGLAYATRVRLITKGGKVMAQGNELRVQGADEVVILLAAATNYRGFAGRQTADPLAATRQDVDRAAAKSYDVLLAAHRQDHRNYFDRVSLQLGDSSTANISNKPTDQRLQDFSKSATDPALAALYFNFGRYLLISSSRPGGLPANLQGIWAEEIQTPWNGDWHLNINVQMNYWPALVASLAELQDPLDALIASLVEPGAKTAQAYYKARGWIAHVISNPWGFTSPGEQASWGATTGGSSWLCEHLWSRYDYTRDKAYLAKIYPILKGSAQFYLDNLMEEPKHGWLVTGPSNSPENAFILPDGRTANVCMGPTIDMQQLRELFGNTARAAEILGVDGDLRKELLAKREKLAPNQIGPDGRLQEWLEPYGETDPHHRHVSLLYGLHPYHEITVEGTPDLAAAARKSLETRGDAGTGWSLAWKMNFWARLRDGERAYRLLTMLLNPTMDQGVMHYNGGGAGSSANLFCFHPPFQIDGNFGGTAGIAEMLLQSHPDNGAPDAPPVIRLLPALPKAWPSGSVKGFGARGNVQVDIQWQDSKLLKAILHPKQDGLYKVRYQDKFVEIKLKGGRTATLNSALTPEEGS